MFTQDELTAIATMAKLELKMLNQVISLIPEGKQDGPEAEVLRNERDLVGAIYGKAVNAARQQTLPDWMTN